MLNQYPIKDFSGGLNVKDAVNLILDNELVTALNAEVGIGYIRKRNGFIAYSNVLTSPIRHLYRFNKNNGSYEVLGASGTNLYKDTNGTLSAITGTLSTSDVELLTYKNRSIADVVLIADGGVLKTYDGTTIANVTAHAPSTNEQTDPGLNDLANLTSFRHMAMKKDRLFAAAHPTVKNRLSFCHHDPTLGYAVYDYFPATFFFDIGDGNGDEITKLIEFRDGLLIFLKRSLYILYGDGRTIQDYNLHKIKADSGCVASKSVKEVDNFIFYLGQDHVYALYSTDQNYVSAEPISQKIEPKLNAIPLSDKEKAVAHYKDDKYYLSFPNGQTFVYDTKLKSWVEWTLQSNAYLTLDDDLYFSQNNQVMKFNTGYSDNGTPIEFKLVTKLIDFNMSINRKKIKYLWIIAKQYEAESTTVSLDVTVDYVPIHIDNIPFDESLVWDEGNWDTSFWDFVDVIFRRVNIRKKGKNIQISITNNTLNEAVEIYVLMLEYKLKKPK